MAEQQSQEQAVFNLEKIYIKDLSFESPRSPALFLDALNPNINIQLNVDHQEFKPEESLFEVVLTLTVDAKQDDNSAFLVELQQAGVFRVQNVTADDLPKVLQITCPDILFPYAREVVSDVVGKGGFPQLLINPVNFAAIYQQKQMAQSKQA